MVDVLLSIVKELKVFEEHIVGSIFPVKSRTRRAHVKCHHIVTFDSILNCLALCVKEFGDVCAHVIAYQPIRYSCT